MLGSAPDIRQSIFDTPDEPFPNSAFNSPVREINEGGWSAEPRTVARNAAHSKAEVFQVTSSGGLFRATANLGVGILFPRGAIAETMLITMQVGN